MPIYDSNNTIITKAVRSALSRPDVIMIKNRTLDGKYHIQSIGQGGTMVDVEANFTMSEKMVFDNLKRTVSMIKVTFDGRYYTGVIDGEPNYNRIASTSGPMFTVTFTLLVQSEGVV